MAGYVRQKATEITNGNLADASDVAAEFNTLDAAFSSATGHKHDGTSAEGPPIEVIGPEQDFIANGSSLTPKTNDAYDLGTSSIKYKDAYFSGEVEANSFGGLGVTQSPTDTTAGRLILTQHGFTRGNLIGTVSQSGGDPTGAVIERGSNSNGEYVRFADGTQICFASIPDAAEITAAAGSVFRSTSETFWTYPASFAATPSVNASRNDTRVWHAYEPGTSSTSLLGFSFRSIGAIQTMRVIAIGRWF